MNAEKTGRFIAERRKQKGYTQKELAEKLMVTDQAIYGSFTPLLTAILTAAVLSLAFVALLRFEKAVKLNRKKGRP